ncbi:MAG TPA: hypothetical protein DCK83_00935 [Gallionellaceae bacterium]|nr:hypothetical protein [Gallionellaceae bacterium]
MKLIYVMYTLALVLTASVARAECVAPDVYTNGTGVSLSGLCTALSTGEIAASTASMDAATNELSLTQLKSYAMQAEQLAQETLATQNAIIQAELLTRQYQENPLEAVIPNVTKLIANNERIAKLANEIANNISNVGTNALKNLENPSSIGLGEGSRFQIWSDMRKQQAMKAYELSKAYWDGAQDRNENINKVIESSAVAAGDTANLKVVSSATAQSLQFLQSIQETLNSIMSGQANDTGKEIADEIAAAKAGKGMADEGFGPPLDIPSDSYMGPGGRNSKPF